MRKQESTEKAAAERREAAQLARLQLGFPLASGEEVAYELAERMLALAGERAIPFLLKQLQGGGFLSDAAITALQGSPKASGQALVLALEADPNRQSLARVLPLDLPAVLNHRLLDLLPDVTDPPTLSYLAQRIAQASAWSVPRLRELQSRQVDLP